MECNVFLVFLVKQPSNLETYIAGATFTALTFPPKKKLPSNRINHLSQKGGWHGKSRRDLAPPRDLEYMGSSFETPTLV